MELCQGRTIHRVCLGRYVPGGILAIMKHITRAAELSVPLVQQLMQRALELETQPTHVARGKQLASLFYEPSTRTRFSFESAMHKLGGNVITTDNAGAFSSAAKGETIEDTIRVVSSYVDAIVLRHTQCGAAARAAAVASVPVINAGDGDGEHPTQALLDLYTIQRERGSVEGTRVAFVGDLKYGRTVHSLVQLLVSIPGVSIELISPPALALPDEYCTLLDTHNVPYEQHEDWGSVLPRVDVLYVTRVQTERLTTPAEAGRCKGAYQLTMQELEHLSNTAVIMHPLPRVQEIVPEVDTDPRAAYFRQVRYGLFMRMALLEYVLDAN